MWRGYRDLRGFALALTFPPEVAQSVTAAVTGDEVEVVAHEENPSQGAFGERACPKSRRNIPEDDREVGHATPSEFGAVGKDEFLHCFGKRAVAGTLGEVFRLGSFRSVFYLRRYLLAHGRLSFGLLGARVI